MLFRSVSDQALSPWEAPPPSFSLTLIMSLVASVTVDLAVTPLFSHCSMPGHLVLVGPSVTVGCHSEL